MPDSLVKAKLDSAVPPGIIIKEILEIVNSLPSLQSQLDAQEYVITLLEPLPELERRVESLLANETILRERRNKPYDLRPLILELSLLPPDENGFQRLKTRLAAREGQTGRPEEVLDALGMQPENARFHRTHLIFKPEFQ